MRTGSPLIYVLNGPNLNLLGRREPAVYGHATLSDIENDVKKRAQTHGLNCVFHQSNHEGALIDWVHEAMDRASGLILNPGGLTHSSVALRDAVAGSGLPTVEVHLTNIHARESFRHHSHISAVAWGVICGLGGLGYSLALDALADRIKAATAQRH